MTQNYQYEEQQQVPQYQENKYTNLFGDDKVKSESSESETENTYQNNNNEYGNDNGDWQKQPASNGDYIFGAEEEKGQGDFYTDPSYN